MSDRKDVLYIAGPYRASTINGIFHNIMEARKRMEWAWTHGFIPICPHTNSAFIDGLVPDDEILPACMEIMLRCDVVMMVRGWRNSPGAVEELRTALEHGMNIVPDPFDEVEMEECE